jgi:glutathione S-transferase
MLTLYYYPSNASFAPHVLLHELGLPFTLALVDRAVDAQRSPQYLKLNPNGLIPVLVDGDIVLHETAAICMHLCDRQSALAPRLASAERAQYTQWLFWMSNTLQAMLIHYFYPDRFVDAGNVDGAAQVKRQAEARIAPMLRQIDDQLAAHGGAWLLGADYCGADPLAFMLCRWTRGFANSRPARDYTHIGPYLKRAFDRPAVQKAVTTEGLTAPFY